MSSPGPFPRRAAGLSVPKGEVVGAYDTYLEAQRVVDHLVKGDFPVAQLSILGTGLTTVERVTRKLSWNRAALEGAASGAWFGLFIGILFFLISTTPAVELFGAAILIGAAFGMLFRLGSYGLARRNRDFQSTSQVLATSYQVLVVQPGRADLAREILARPVGHDEPQA